MSSNEKFRVVKNGEVLVDYGPVTIVIKAKIKNEPYTEAAITGANAAIDLLNQLIPSLDEARKFISCISNSSKAAQPAVLRTMMDSVAMLHEKDFTPMAAVAGTFSDFVKYRILECGADYVVVNNGGDISFQLPPLSDEFRAGIISDLSLGKVTHAVKIIDRGIKGIATSGFGGRSLTKGIASAVTVLASTGSLADAAATSIANATNCEDASIERCLAEEIDYFTDIKGAIVTKSIGNLKGEKIETAVKSGLIRASELYNQEVIKGCVIFLKNYMALWPESPSSFTITELC
ncbi:MAG: hypothetical protein VB106_10075 [Clostridiaceae bacterium]|nr:hypothetical protein [Clostridiaceae bacterium]